MIHADFCVNNEDLIKLITLLNSESWIITGKTVKECSNLRLLEYQAKNIFKAKGILTPRGILCKQLEDVEKNYDFFKNEAILKAQVPIGKRGKAGGIKIVNTRDEAIAYAKSLFNAEICGYNVSHILMEEVIPWDEEYYLSVITDTESQHSCPMVLFTTTGGMEIEVLLNDHPESLHRVHVDPRYGLMEFELRNIVEEANVCRELQKQIMVIMHFLYDIYWKYDAEIVEINPLGLTADLKLVALDGKISIDNSALFRQKDVEKPLVMDTAESIAAEKGLSYVELDGDIGIISNGAGLTMATMDQLALAGCKPANFMDTGARILEAGIEDGLEIINSHPGLKAILINVFGGGVRCDIIAQKICNAMDKKPRFSLPIIVCLQGRNYEEGHSIIEKSNHPALRLVQNMEEAVVAVRSLGGNN